MKNLLLGFTFLLSMGAFAQHTAPVIPDYQVITYESELYACNTDGSLIKNPYNPKYQKYTVYLSYMIRPDQHLEPLHITLQNRLCATGTVEESPNVTILNIEYSRPLDLRL